MKKKRNLDDSTLPEFLRDKVGNLIVAGTCRSCHSLLYLGDRVCPRCGFPVGDSLTEDDLERLYSLFEPNPVPPVGVVDVPEAMGVSSDNFCCFSTNAPYTFGSSN
jgi:hypothetical protein